MEFEVSRRPLERPNLPIGKLLEHFGADLSRARNTGWSKIRCPFHDDSAPSATVNLEINRFQCWSGCTTRAEDTVGLLMHVEGLDFKAALAEAEAITGTSHQRVRGKRGSSAALFGGSWYS